MRRKKKLPPHKRPKLSKDIGWEIHLRYVVGMYMWIVLCGLLLVGIISAILLFSKQMSHDGMAAGLGNQFRQSAFVERGFDSRLLDSWQQPRGSKVS